MVQKPRSESRRRGRPPRFERDDVVDSAIAAFWSKGVDRVTLDDLEAAAGVDRSTLYNSFDGKAGLYREAAARYVERTVDEIFAPLTDVDDGVEAVCETLERLRDSIRGGELPTGCLIVNDLTSPNVDPVASARYLEELRGGLGAAASRAVASGAIRPDAADDLVEVVVVGVLGVNVTTRAVGRVDAVRAVDALIATVRGSQAS